MSAPLGGALGGRPLGTYGPGALPVAAACCAPVALPLFTAAGHRAAGRATAPPVRDFVPPTTPPSDTP
ncbi:hypothetical protein [Streptomyces sp. NPDC048516]|uniref:hypothetical protein n=1 Tax=Streptomyces sp. NPDC048516 TaxID=3365565 RepID=UPI003718AE7A